jgi:ribonucleotide reductase alpha subunit
MSAIIDAHTLLSGLDKVDPSVYEILARPYDSNVILNKATALASDSINYDNFMAGARLLMYTAVRVCPLDTRSYVKNLSHILSEPVKEFMMRHADEIDSMINSQAVLDYRNFDMISASAMINSYLLRPGFNEDPQETPQQMYMRMAVQLYYDEGIQAVRAAYFQMSGWDYTHASPTIFNAGTKRPQMASCFLLQTDDNLDSLMDVGVKEASKISQSNGGMGINMQRIRHSPIGNFGMSSGVMPFARIYNSMIKCVNQGGKRQGAATIFLRIFHIDIEEFIRSTDNFTDHQSRLDAANTCIWMSDLFYARLEGKTEEERKWTLFCPAQAPSLNELYGQEFEAEYVRLERLAEQLEKRYQDSKMKLAKAKDALLSEPQNLALRETFDQAQKEEILTLKQRITHKVLDAKKLYDLIINNQIRSSMPYLMNGDTINAKNNQVNLGPINSSNLCVAPETKILILDEGTKCGTEVPIGELEGKEVQVWNGTVFSKVTVVKTGTDQPMVKVRLVAHDTTFDAGVTRGTAYEIHCTHYHKFLMAVDSESPSESTRIPIIDNPRLPAYCLKAGDTLRPFWVGGSLRLLKVACVIDAPNSDTYCFNEPLNNAGVFNGVLTGQCLEINEWSNPDNIASCNLASINLSKFPVGKLDWKTETVTTELLQGVYDFSKLGSAVRAVVNNLDKVITHNWYPLDKHDASGKVTERGKISKLNMRMRPLGIGVSGLFEAYTKCEIIYDSKRAELLNKMIFACMYFNAMIKSLELAIRLGHYSEFRTGKCQKYHGGGLWETCDGSPLSNGQFQFDLWAQEARVLKDQGRLDESIYQPDDDKPIDPRAWGQEAIKIKCRSVDGEEIEVVVEPNWESLRDLVRRWGVRHSLLIAPMPTATTAQILRNTESTEAPQGVIYVRKVRNEAFTIVIPELIRDLTEINLWTEKLVKFVIQCQGTIKYLDYYVEDHPEEFDPSIFETLPDGTKVLKTAIRKRLSFLQKKYRTMYEISMKTAVLRQARQRGIYICQSQSMNLFLRDPTPVQLEAMHSYASKLRLKTGMYYLRQDPSKFTGSFANDPSILAYYELLLKRIFKHAPANSAVLRAVEAEEKAVLEGRDNVCEGCSL